VTHLLDAGPLVAYLFERPTAVALIEPWVASRELAASMVVCAEAAEHILNQPGQPRYMAGLSHFLRVIPTADLNLDVAIRYATLRRSLRPPHGPGLIGDMDTLIAATALAHDLTLVSVDAHFARVPGLKLLAVPRRFS